MDFPVDEGAGLEGEGGDSDMMIALRSLVQYRRRPLRPRLVRFHMATRTRNKTVHPSNSRHDGAVEAKPPTVARPHREGPLNVTRNDLPLDARTAVVALLNARLADLIDLYSQVKQAHWNVKGPGFHAVHEFLDDLAEVVEDFADEVAERAVQLGGTAHGTIRMAAANSSLPEYPDRLYAQQRTLQVIADRLAIVAATVRAGIDATDDAGDADTADLLTDVSRGLDKYLWFTESHLHPG
jgi:starvation-inducible DNA-binding protein